jgi:hypothetical protein
MEHPPFRVRYHRPDDHVLPRRPCPDRRPIAALIALPTQLSMAMVMIERWHNTIKADAIRPGQPQHSRASRLPTSHLPAHLLHPVVRFDDG